MSLPKRLNLDLRVGKMAAYCHETGRRVGDIETQYWTNFDSGLTVTIHQTRSMPCLDHPRYQVKRQPRVACEGCWRAWFENERL